MLGFFNQRKFSVQVPINWSYKNKGWCKKSWPKRFHAEIIAEIHKSHALKWSHDPSPWDSHTFQWNISELLRKIKTIRCLHFSIVKPVLAEAMHVIIFPFTFINIPLSEQKHPVSMLSTLEVRLAVVLPFLWYNVVASFKVSTRRTKARANYVTKTIHFQLLVYKCTLTFAWLASTKILIGCQ